MRMLRLSSCLPLGLAFVVTAAQEQRPGTAVVPKTWDDAAIATLEIPLANPVGSPKHASSDYYYRIPVAPIYKNYPVYVPGREPAGYFERLTHQAPEVVWDDTGHRPPLDTEADWIRAGELVFDAPVKSGLLMSVDDVRNPAWYAKVGWMAAADGTLPIVRYVIRQKGIVAVETLACGNCHTRLMPDGSVLKGAQGNYAIGRPNNARLRELAQSPAAAATWTQQRLSLRGTFAVPWLTPDPQARIDAMTLQEFIEMQATFPPGIIPRQRGSPLFPNQVPDLIGIKDRRYLDRTGLQTHRSIGDLMRYAAMNRGIMDGGDAFADHNGFIPGDVPRFQRLPDPSTRSRYSDEQLYALASYLYSLQPPRNPNRFDALAERGQRVFERAGCATCHTPPLYTNNKLTPADGFDVPPAHREKYDILPISVGTDPDLTLKTRRGTGYYKVPSLKGVWYRSMFGHSGWCATLEDWFDPRRVRDDYVPTGWKPHDRRTYAVKGHSYGLNLSDEDRGALIAFLKTL
jgi:Di-haem oxidoreductase, putative peroxidase